MRAPRGATDSSASPGHPLKLVPHELGRRRRERIEQGRHERLDAVRTHQVSQHEAHEHEQRDEAQKEVEGHRRCRVEGAVGPHSEHDAPCESEHSVPVGGGGRAHLTYLNRSVYSTTRTFSLESPRARREISLSSSRTARGFGAS